MMTFEQFRDIIVYGTYYEKNGKRVDPRDVYFNVENGVFEYKQK